MKIWIKKMYFLWKHGSIEQKWSMKIQNQALYISYFVFLNGPREAIAPPSPSIASSLLVYNNRYYNVTVIHM